MRLESAIVGWKENNLSNKTQCPNCRAIYEITDEQFRLSKGKVRCGTCRVPFQAKILDEAYIRPSRNRSSRVSPEISTSLPKTEASTSKKRSREAPSVAVPASAPISPAKTEKNIDNTIREVKRQLEEEEQPQEHTEPSYEDLMQDYEKSVARVVTDKQPPPTHIAPAITQPEERPDSASEMQLDPDRIKPRKKKPNDAVNFEDKLKSEVTIEIEGEDSAWLDFSELNISSRTSVAETQSTEPPIEKLLSHAELALRETNNSENDHYKQQTSTALLSENLDQDSIAEIDNLIDQTVLEQEQPLQEEPDSELEIEMPQELATQSINSQVDEQALDTPPIKSARQPLPYKITAKGNGKRRWLLVSLLLLASMILGLGLIYQLWHKQMLPWIGIEKIADTVAPMVAPIAEPLIGKFTEKFEVSIPVRRDLSKLQLLSARTEAHPTRSSTTLLRVSMINHANIRQPYPWLEVSLTDQEGRLVARRALSPDNYLHNNRVDNTIGPKQLKPVTIEFLTFPKQVEGYELKLLNN